MGLGFVGVPWPELKTISAVPSQSGSLTFNGSTQMPGWYNYNPEALTLGGTTSGTNAGSYKATFTPKEGYQWADGTTTAKEAAWTIGRATISVPSQSGSLTYTGSAQSPSWSGYNSGKMTLGGTASGTNAGSYNATFTPTSNYQWSGGSTAAKSVVWTIGRASLTVPVQNEKLTYTGSSQSPTWKNYDSSKMTIGGTTSGTNVGSYSAAFTPKSNYQWPDGTTTARSVSWTIDKAILTVPAQSGTLTYTGNSQTPLWSGYDSAKMTLGGTASGTNAGTYTVTFTPKSGYQWPDGSTSAKSVTWTIGKASLSVPTVSGSKTYTGSSLSPTWSGYDSGKMTLGGTCSAIEAGTYTATVTPKANYQWSDGTTAAKNVSWTINKATLTVPTQKGALTYTGNSQSPAWNNYDSGKMTLGGTTSGTDAGSYNVTFTPKASCQWSGGSTAAKTVAWSIGKAAGSLSLNKTSMTLNVSSLTGTIAVTKAGGAVSAASSNTSVAAVSVSGTTVTVTAKAKGSATITVSVAADANHTAPASKTCAITVDLPSSTLADNTPAAIQAAAKAGVASNYWSVGDKIPIALNGTVGSLTLNDTYYAVILGFNHNADVEGGNSIHFQFGKDSAGVDVAFCDTGYNSHNSNNANSRFVMNTSNTNSGGWNNSYMRKTICPAFLSTMPMAWQNVISACTKYSDNTGGNNIDSYVTSTSDKIWLLSEFEVHGSRSYANGAEQNYQKQYDYYKNGNSKVRYQHSSTSSTCHWWLRSVYASYTTAFCIVYTSGSETYSYAYYSFGFAPGFKVA